MKAMPKDDLILLLQSEKGNMVNIGNMQQLFDEYGDDYVWDYELTVWKETKSNAYRKAKVFVLRKENEVKRMIPIKIERREPVMKWIPVSEAMPEESDGTVLVCMPNKFPYSEKEPFVNAKHNRQVETATYSQYSDTWHYTNGGVKSTRPIAWMPLPEPWKGEDDEAD